jgi:signal transduction histidine kinase/ActR/RegA family two-component response regulator
MNKMSSIEKRVLWLAMVPVLLLAVLLDGYFIYFGFNDLDVMFHDRNQLFVKQLVATTEYGVFSDNRDLLQQQVNAMLDNAEVKSVAVHNRDHHLLAVVGNLTYKVNQKNPIYDDGQSVWIYQNIYPTQLQIDDSVEMIAPPAIALGNVIIEVSKHAENQEKRDFLLINLALVTSVLIGLLIAVRRLSHRFTAPVLAMRRAVQRVGAGYLDERISSRFDIAEFQELAAGFNQMSSQLQSERANLEQRIEAATLELKQKKTEAEEANANKTKFLAAASHDLRQPMHALGLFVGEMQNLMTSTEQKQVAERIEQSVEAMSGLLDSLLDVSKLDAGVVVPHLQAVDLDSIFRRLAHDYSAIAVEKNIELRVKPTAFVVYSDPQLLERIIGNLLSNAVRYTPANGTIFMGCRRRGERVEIEVRDNGIGIDPAQHQAIFGEFVQLANKERDRGKGLGLGLSIVQRLVTLLGHQLELRSQVNLGSTFVLALKLFDVQARPAHIGLDRRLISRGHPKIADQKVLVVDDDILVRESTKGIIESWGCRVTVTESVAEALKWCRETNFDLVICDYRLKDGNGLQVAEYLKSHSSQHANFILITGDTSPDILSTISQLDFNMLSKPVRPAKLRSLILHLLNRNVSVEA